MLTTNPLRLFWRFAAWFVMSQLCVVLAMASCPELHDCCHEHSHLPAHECAVTLILHGGFAEVLPDIVPLDIRNELPSVWIAGPVAIENEASHLIGGVLAHAPPRGP